MDTECDVLIIGSGIIGATYAKRLTDKMHNVIMVEVGEMYVLSLVVSVVKAKLGLAF